MTVLETSPARRPAPARQDADPFHLPTQPRSDAPSDAPSAQHGGPEAWLARALHAGERHLAESVALLLWRHEGLPAAYGALARCLDRAQQDATRGDLGAQAARRTATTARALLDRLPSVVNRDDDGSRVVLASPVGDREALALTALAHRVREAGFRPLVVDDLPPLELALLAAREDTLAVVVSAQRPWSAPAAQRTVTSLRRLAPELLVAVAGPGAPGTTRRCWLRAETPEDLLQGLRFHSLARARRASAELFRTAAGGTAAGSPATSTGPRRASFPTTRHQGWLN